MSLVTASLLGYFALGLAFAFVVTVKKKKKARTLGVSEEPALFWLYLLVWPLMALLWFAGESKGEK